MQPDFLVPAFRHSAVTSTLSIVNVGASIQKILKVFSRGNQFRSFPSTLKKVSSLTIYTISRNSKIRCFLSQQIVFCLWRLTYRVVRKIGINIAPTIKHKFIGKNFSTCFSPYSLLLFKNKQKLPHISIVTLAIPKNPWDHDPTEGHFFNSNIFIKQERFAKLYFP